MQSRGLHALTFLAFGFHIGGGALGLVSGTVAVIARKGGRLHRKAGTVFVVSMLVMAVFGCYLAFVMPDQRVNVFISVFALYLVLTAWLAIKRRDGATGRAEKVALLVGTCLCAPFAILSVQLALGLTPLFRSAVPFKGPVLIAIYGFTSVLAIAAIGDAKVVLAGGISGVSRISRHLWRMCLGLTLAAGSGFTNGFARLLPGPYHVPPAFFLPQLIPLGLLVFWMVRIRQANSDAIVLTARRASAGSGAVESHPPRNSHPHRRPARAPAPGRHRQIAHERRSLWHSVGAVYSR